MVVVQLMGMELETETTQNCMSWLRGVGFGLGLATIAVSALLGVYGWRGLLNESGLLEALLLVFGMSQVFLGVEFRSGKRNIVGNFSLMAGSIAIGAGIWLSWVG
jgi:hypothetical protein